MKKVLKNVMFASAMLLAFGVVALTTSCKGGSAKPALDGNDSIAIVEAVLSSLDSLDGSLTKALKACGQSCSEDDEMEVVDFDIETDDEGNEMPVAHIKLGGEIFQIIDLDYDGTFDVAVFDADEDGEISDEEIVDITDDNITLDDIAEAVGGADADEDGYVAEEDEDYDEEESIVERTSRDTRGPSRQRQEAAAEENLPDYVNNARVKAFKKK